MRNTQEELSTLKEKFANSQQVISNLTNEKNALELALFEKRLENSKNFLIIEPELIIYRLKKKLN